MTGAQLPLSKGPVRAHPPGDVALAVGTAALVMTGSALALRAASLRGEAALAEADVGTGVVVAVRPVVDIDSPLLELGGGRSAKLPSAWTVRRPKGPREAVKQAPALPTSEKTAPRTPRKAEEETDEDEEATGTDAGATSPLADGGDKGGSNEIQGNTDADGGVPGAPPGPGSPEGSPSGTSTDPLAARALDVYRARIVLWFSSRFRVSGSGLSQATLTSLRATATVQIGPDGRVTGYSLQSSGNATFDAAARAALDSSRGQAIPPPPESYPDLQPSSISLTFVCKEGRCD